MSIQMLDETGQVKEQVKCLQGERFCNICKQPFKPRNRYIRFCSNCRKSVRYRDGERFQLIGQHRWNGQPMFTFYNN